MTQVRHHAVASVRCGRRSLSFSGFSCLSRSSENRVALASDSFSTLTISYILQSVLGRLINIQIHFSVCVIITCKRTSALRRVFLEFRVDKISSRKFVPSNNRAYKQVANPLFLQRTSELVVWLKNSTKKL